MPSTKRKRRNGGGSGLRLMTARRRLRRLQAVVLAMATTAVSLVAVVLAGQPAQAAPPSGTRVISNNMQGASLGSSGGSKWTTSISEYARRADIVLLQEAGPTPPPSSQFVSQIPWANGLPGRAGYVQHHTWMSGGIPYQVYFLQTDRTGGTFQGGRVNSAIVTHTEADEVRVVPNPTAGGRPALGVRFGNDWYFTFHGLSGGGRDSASMLRDIDSWVELNGGNDHTWTVGGDFNIDPSALENSAQFPPSIIHNTGLATQVSGGELDYFVSSEPLAPDHPVQRMDAASPDHWAVSMGIMRMPMLASRPLVHLMPTGDSETWGGIGSSTGAGYRGQFYDSLAQMRGSNFGSIQRRAVAADEAVPVIRELDFVGTQRSGNAKDPDHEGYPGYEIEGIADRLDAAVPTLRPNVVTLMAGTNDMNNNTDPAGAPGRLGRLIDQILEDAPDATVLVAGLMPASNAATQARIEDFNPQVFEQVNERREAGKHVAFVDMSHVTTADLSDGLHPNDTGYAKMADAFTDGVHSALLEGWIKDANGGGGTCNTAPGTWVDRGKIASGVGATRNNVEFADFDGDGRDDYLVVDPTSGAVRAWINKGGDNGGTAGWVDRGQVASGTSPAEDEVVRFADLDGDGRDDYLLVDDDGGVRAWINKGGDNGGTAGWVERGKIASGVGSSSTSIHFADFDGDGRDDYLVVDPTSGAVRAWINKGGDNGGTAGWVDRGQVASGVGGRRVVFGNVNCDKRADYLVLDSSSGAVNAWLNAGGDNGDTPGWIDRGQIASGAGGNPDGIRFADIDGDGLDDYLVIDDDGGVRAWINKGGDPA